MQTHAHRAFYGDSLQSAVEASLKEGLANCRSYFRHGYGPEVTELRERLGRWDALSDPKNIPKYKGSFLKIIELTEYTDIDTKLQRENDYAFVELARSQLNIYEEPTGQYLVYPQDIVERMAQKVKKELESNVGFLQDNSNMAIKVKFDVKPFPIRKGKVQLKLKIGWKCNSIKDEKNVPWDLLNSKVRMLAGDAIVTKAEQEKRQLIAQSEEERLVRNLASTWIDEVCEEIRPQISWLDGWPVCIKAFYDDINEIAKVHIENDPNWVILNPQPQKLEAIGIAIVQEGIHEGLQQARRESISVPENSIIPDGPFDYNGQEDGFEEDTQRILHTVDARFPVARFGKLITVDRKEIESYRSIRNLMREYLAKLSDVRPLSVAVFGPPGSGKSFGVKEIARSVSSNVVECEYNVSQFTSLIDLANALIQTRDTSIGGNKVPLIFFDEFDTMLEGESLGWLKYFLSVMQDGKFRHGDSDLSVGQAIFVFAGGTSRSYLEFTRKNAAESEKNMFRLAKGPDFVSRLRGFVDILGPNRLLEPNPKDADKVFIIRRAIILRGLLEKKYQRLTDHRAGPLDEKVARALLNVWGYEHGTRSLEAVLEMSALATAERFEKSALPPKEQLSMHLSEHPQKPNEFDELLRG